MPVICAGKKYLINDTLGSKFDEPPTLTEAIKSFQEEGIKNVEFVGDFSESVSPAVKLKINLKEITENDYPASKGKIRAVIFKNGKKYQVNEDVDRIEEGINLPALADNLEEKTRMVQLFNDKGEPFYE